MLGLSSASKLVLCVIYWQISDSSLVSILLLDLHIPKLQHFGNVVCSEVHVLNRWFPEISFVEFILHLSYIRDVSFWTLFYDALTQ